MPNMNKVGYHLPEDHPAAFAATHEAMRRFAGVLQWMTLRPCTSLYFAPRSMAR